MAKLTLKTVNEVLAKKVGLTLQLKKVGGSFEVLSDGLRRNNDHWKIKVHSIKELTLEQWLSKVRQLKERYPLIMTEQHDNLVEEGLRVIHRCIRAIKTGAQANLFLEAIKNGLDSYSQSAAEHDLRKAPSMYLVGLVLGELLSFIRNSRKNQVNCLRHITHILYNWYIHYGSRAGTKTKKDCRRRKMAVTKKTVSKKAVKKTATDQPKLSIGQLLEQLAATDDAGEKRRIRQRLRHQGHTGGLIDQKKAGKKQLPAKKAEKKKRAVKPAAEE